MDKLVVAAIGGIVYVGVSFGLLYVAVKVVKYAWVN